MMVRAICIAEAKALIPFFLVFKYLYNVRPRTILFICRKRTNWMNQVDAILNDVVTYDAHSAFSTGTEM